MLRHIRRRSPPTNPLNGGLFHATAATKPDCAGAGSGERHDETEQTLLKHPHISLSTARPPGGVHRHTTTPRQRGGRHATGPVSAHRRDGMFRAPICERDWRPSCVLHRSSFVVVVSGQWCCTRCDTRDNRRLVAIKTAFARWRNPDELRGTLQHADETTKLHPISKIGLAKWHAANMA